MELHLRRRGGPAALLALLLPLALAPGAPARQDAGLAGPETGPIRLGTLGIELIPPPGAIRQDRTRGDQIDVTLLDAGTPAAWSMRLLTMQSPVGDAPAAEQIEHVLESRRVAIPGLAVLVNEPVECSTGLGQLCFVEPGGGAGDTAQGWFCFPLGDGLVLLATIQARTDALESTRATLRASFATLRAPDLDVLVAARRALLEDGRAFLEGLTEEDLRSVIAPAQWFRTYRPAGPGQAERELGCFYLEVTDGPRGAVNPQRSPESFGSGEQATGLLVRLWSEQLTDDDDSSFRSEACYWLAWDQSEEVWSVRQTISWGRQDRSNAISGVRAPRTSASPGGLLQVVVSKNDGGVREAPPATTVPRSYFSQALRWVEGRLFRRIAGQPTELGYYCVDTSSDDVTITPRIDKIDPIGPGRWRLRSRPRTDGPVTETIYREDGTMIRRTWPDDSRTEPIELEELLRIWNRKGIEAGRVRNRRRR